jgi:hypothetical protein
MDELVRGRVGSSRVKVELRRVAGELIRVGVESS